MLTADEQAELAHIQGLLGSSTSTPNAPQSLGLTSRFSEDVANIPSGIGNTLIGGAAGLYNLAVPTWNLRIQQPPRVPNVYDVPAPQNWKESAVDLGPAIATQVGAAMIPGGAVTRLGRAAGLGADAAALMGDFTGGAFLGAPQGAGEAAGTGAEFTAMGAAQRFIPNPWLKAAANVAIPAAGQIARGQPLLSQQSLTNDAVNALVPALLGQYARRGEAKPLLQPAETPAPAWMEGDPYTPDASGAGMQVRSPSEPPVLPPSMLNREAPPAPAPFMPPAPPVEGGTILRGAPQPLLRKAAVPSEPVQTESFWDQQARAHAEEQQARLDDFHDFVGSQGHELLDAVRNLGGLPSIAKDSSLRGETKRLWETGNRGRVMKLVNRSQDLSLDGLREGLEQFGFRYGTPAEMLDAIESRLSTNRPEYGFEPSGGMLGRGDEAASTIPPLLQYLGSGAAGAVAGPLIDNDPNKPLWARMAEGAAMGLGARALGPTLLRATRFDPEGRLGMLGVPESRIAPEDYARLADQRYKEMTKTPPVTPTPEDASRIRTAYDEVRATSDFPAVKIADVLERAGFTPETMDQGRGILAAMQKTGDAHLSSGDWSIAKPRERAWGIGLFDSKPTNPQPKQLLMRMPDAPAKAGGEWSGANLGENPVTAIRTTDGKVYADATARTHFSAVENLGIDPSRVQDGGFIVNGEYRSGSADSAGIGERARAASRVAEKRGMLRKSAESGSLDLSNPAFQYGLGAGLGALAGPVVDQDPNHPWGAKMLLGAIGGAGLVAGGKGLSRLLSAQPTTQNVTTATPAAKPGLLARAEEAAQRQEGAGKGFESSRLGQATRLLEREFKLGQSPLLTRADEFGKGEANLLRKQAEPLLKTLSGATDPERQALLKYEQNPRTSTSEPLLRAAVRPEIADAALQGEQLVGKAQELIARATDDPKKQRLLGDTFETYRTTKYAAFQEPEKWQAQLRDPKLTEDYVQQLITDKELPGFSEPDVRQAVEQYKADILRGSDFTTDTGSGSKISRQLWTHRKDLSPEHKAFLGEYTDPAQRLAFTMQKLINSAAQAKKIETLANLGSAGELPILSMAERQAKWNAAQTSGDKAAIENLASLVRMPNNPAFGKLADKFVSRDVLDSINAHNELWSGGWLKAFSGATSIMKGSMTVANPATHARQWIQTPLLAAVARVAPWDFFPAGRALKARGAEYEELVRNHIVGADFSSQEMGRAAQQMDLAYNPSNADKAAGAWRTLKDKAQKWYGMPDNLVRAAAYLKQKPRFFAEGNAAGLKGAELEQYAQNRATDFVNRYTMNYGQVANAVKVLRETPFVSPFISYQAEMLRLMKNLGEDAIKGDAKAKVWALGNMAGLVAMPLIIEQASKAGLSDKDQAEWDRTQRLSPAYSGGQIRVPIRRKADGSFDYVNIGNLVPAGDLSALARNLASGDGSKLLASNPYVGWEKTPVFNTIATLASGRDSVSDRKLESAGDYAQAIGRQALPPLTPYIGYEAQRIGSAFTRNDQGGLGLTNARTGRTDTPGMVLLRQVGLPLSTVQPRQLLQRAKADAQEKESAIKSELNQLLRTNAAPEVKQEARQRALLKLREVREETRQLLR